MCKYLDQNETCGTQNHFKHWNIRYIRSENIFILIDDICAAPAKAVKYLRLVLRNGWFKKRLDYQITQGCIAKSFELKSFPGSNDSLCRHRSTKVENAIHVLNGYSSMFHIITLRHNNVQRIVTNHSRYHGS